LKKREKMKIHCTKKLLAKLPENKNVQTAAAQVVRNDLPDNIIAFPNSEIHQKDNFPKAERENSPAANPIGDWHANLLTTQRRQCIIFDHDKTRFALFISCLTKLYFLNLDFHFQDVLMNTLLKSGIEPELIEKLPNHFSPLDFDSNCDRTVQGTMNRMAGDLKHMIEYDRLDITDVMPYSTSAWLSERPCMVKGVSDCLWPVKEMAKLLENL